MNTKPTNFFITYAHEDVQYREELEKHLNVMKQKGEISFWSDNEIVAGDKWREKIFENLSDCDILLYLTSVYSLTSENCKKELAEVLKNQNKRVIPIILDYCNWEEWRNLSDFQAIPSENRTPKPVCDWTPQSKAWKSIVNELRKTINSLKKQGPGGGNRGSGGGGGDRGPRGGGGDRGPGGENETIAMQFFREGNTVAFLGQHKSALALYDKTIELTTQFAGAYNNRGIVKSTLGDYHGALADYDKAIEINPQMIGVYSNRGAVKVDIGDPQGAIEDYSKEIKLNPQLVVAYSNRGNVKGDLGKYEEAMDDYDKAIKIDPQYSPAYNHRGTIKSNIGQHKEAISDYNEAIKINPQYTAAYSHRGTANGKLGKYDDAIDDFSKAIKLSPKNANDYKNRGGMRMTNGDYFGAIVDYDKAIEINPQYAEAYCLRGLAKKESHDQTAKQDFEQALFLARKQGELVAAELAQRELNKLKKSENPPPKKD